MEAAPDPKRPGGVEPPPRRNRFATAAVILGVIGLVAPAGFALSSIGFMVALVSRQRREPRAVAALVFTAVATVVAVWAPILVGGAIPDL